MIFYPQQRLKTGTSLFLAGLVWLMAVPVLSDEIPGSAEFDESSASIAAGLEQRLQQFEQSQAALVEQNRRLTLQMERLQLRERLQESDSTRDASMLPSSDRPPVDVGEAPVFDTPGRASSVNFSSLTFDTAEDFPHEVSSLSVSGGAQPGRFYANFDRGFVIRPTDADESPFELKINGQNQIRYTGFERVKPTWTDSAGIVTPLSNQSSFQIPRGRLIFSGFAFRKEALVQPEY